MRHKAQNLLKTVFGYETFLPFQQEVIANVLSHKDTLVIMPTGGGKSLCYQLPALIFEGLTIVVSPLISLMKDQVEQLLEVGVSAVYLNSSLSREAYQDTKKRIQQGHVKLLYVAPETLLMEGMLAFLQNIQVDCLTIDEAHCISEWGHEFRPEYRQLVAVREQFPKAVCVALTATATPRVQKDIQSCLGFEDANSFIASFNRENLFLQIILKIDPYFQITDFLDQFKDQSGIIYCFSRRQVDDLSADLAAEGYSVRPYHAGLDDGIRKANQEAFIRDDIRIMVATIAFGMGINKSNVRFVIHHDLPKNIESYYQQIGRAGRDRLRAHCLLLFSYGDIQKINYFIRQMDEPEKRIAEMHLDALIQFAESKLCRRVVLLSYFGEQVDITDCGMCDNCLETDKILEDITIPAQMFLSCVKRTGEKFGAGHIIDVLRGSQSQKVIRFKHDQLSTYGIGKEYTKKGWQYFSRQFLAQNFLEQDLEYRTLQITVKGWNVLKKKEQVMGTHAPEEIDYSKAKKDKLDYESVLFEILRKKRKELADDADVPPYVIFSDRTLVEMASVFPRTQAEIQRVFGVGQVKLDKYGEIFLQVINRYCEANGIQQKTVRKSVRSLSRPSNKRKRCNEVGEAYNAGESIQHLMDCYHVKMVTILSHLFKYIQSGQSIRTDDLLSLSHLNKEKQETVLKAFDHLGAERLGSVFETCNQEISYDALHLLRLYYLSRKE